jgi:hypothetical protein
MNLVGKIFTVFILLMSVVFMGFAVAVYAVQENWRLVADNDKPTVAHKEGLAQQLTKAKAETSELQKKKDDLEAQCKIEKDRQDKVNAELRTAAEDAQKAKAEAERTVATKEEQLRVAVMAVDASLKTADNFAKENNQLREDIKLARDDRDAQFKKVVGLTDDLNSAVTDWKRLAKANQDLAAQLAKARAINEYFHLDENSMLKEPPPDLSGRVVGVQPPDLVEVSLGSDDGLRKGHTLFVIRPGDGGMKYVGKITVLNDPASDKAVCRVVKPLTVPIERGDLVRAKL